MPDHINSSGSNRSRRDLGDLIGYDKNIRNELHTRIKLRNDRSVEKVIDKQRGEMQ